MYSSLDRADIVLKPGPDGRKQYVQTDHRSAEEIEQEPELSALFALVRILNPKRMVKPGEPEPIVIYAAKERLPRFLVRVIRAVGGVVEFGSDSLTEPDWGDTPSLEEVIASSFANMAQAVVTEFGVVLSTEGLAVVERALAEGAGSPEGNEIAYWSAVMKLGSFGGEIIRLTRGGKWEVSDSGSLPFALSTTFRGEPAVVNPLGKAIKRFANGEEDSLVFLVETLLQGT